MTQAQQTCPHVYVAISEVMGKLAKVGIGKNNKNAQQNYKFRGIDDVYNALAPHLSESKLLILPRVQSRSVSEQQSKSGGILFYVVVDVEFDFVSAMDGSTHVVRMVGEAMDSGDKASNKAMSAAYKYACMEAFCIPTEGDNDADATTHEVAANNSENERPPISKPLDRKKADLYISEMMKSGALKDDGAIHQLWEELKADQDTAATVWRELKSKFATEFAYINSILKPTKSTGEGRRA